MEPHIVILSAYGMRPTWLAQKLAEALARRFPYVFFEEIEHFDIVSGAQVIAFARQFSAANAP